MSVDRFDALHAYYNRHGIGAEDFHCSHVEACRGDCADFSTAKEAYVGARFGSDSLPRLVFLSLDSGDGGDGGPEERTLEYLQQVEERVRVDKLPKNRHWYQTRLLALSLLGPLKPELDIRAVHRHFAHTNSAKCCLNRDGRREADQRLFDNCRSYIPGELEVLAPAILVTQGKWARLAVQIGFAGKIGEPRRDPSEAGAYRLVSLTGPNSTIWLSSDHPRHFGTYRQQKRRDWPAWADVIRERFG